MKDSTQPLTSHLFAWCTSDSEVNYFLSLSAFSFLTRGKKAGGTVAIRREPRVFKPNIWPPTSRMERRGCSFFRGRKQWMLLEGWGPVQGPAWVTDMWMSGSASLFKRDLWERGQGDLWGNLSSMKMFQLLVAHGTKRPHNLSSLQVFLFRNRDSPGGFQSSLILLVFFKGWSKTPPTVATHSFHHRSLSAHYVPLHQAKQAFKLFNLFFLHT